MCVLLFMCEYCVLEGDLYCMCVDCCVVHMCVDCCVVCLCVDCCVVCLCVDWYVAVDHVYTSHTM